VKKKGKAEIMSTTMRGDAAGEEHFELPPRLEEMLREAGYRGVVELERIDGEPFDEHDRSSAEALIATHDLERFEREHGRKL
jgi:hypothetical protein